jgi:Bacterial Ig domain
MRLWISCLSLLLSTTSIAVAATPTSGGQSGETGAAPYPVFVAGQGDRQLARQLVPGPASSSYAATSEASREATSQLAQSRTLYLNRNGAQLQPSSVNDARLQKSTIASKSVTLPAWAASPTVWNDTVQCLRDLFAPFAVKIVTEEPGNVPHLEAIFGGSATLLGLPRGVVGISPFNSTCTTIENSIVFVFTDELPANAHIVCEVMAQEIAHSYGLDHELLASDPMTYLPYKGKRAFQNETASCGEKEARPCGINGSTCRAQQNSVQLLSERLGVADPKLPTGELTAPADGERVGRDFDIDVTASDNIAVSSVEFFVDDVSIGTRTAAPYTLAAEGITAGAHTIAAIVTDQARNLVRTSAVSVTVEADSSGGCNASRQDAGSSTRPSTRSGATSLGLLGLALVTIGARRWRR